MFISVIIPAYNAAATIVKSLQSLQSQTVSTWEAIVVNDGSTDNTEYVVKSMVETDKRISLITQENKGVSAARNAGIEAARYDWVLFIDADDWIANNYFELMFANINANCDAVVCGWARVDEEGQVIHELIPPQQEDMFPLLSIYSPLAIHACVIKKVLLKTAGGFDEGLKTCEDWDLWQRIARAGARFYVVQQVLAYYVMRPNSLSKEGIQFYKDALHVLRLGHKRDERVKIPLPQYEKGLPDIKLDAYELYLSAWMAGIFIGQQQDPSNLLSLLRKDIIVPGIYPEVIANNLIESLSISIRKPKNCLYQIWTNIEKEISDYLEQLEKISKSKYLKRRTLVLLERQIILSADFSEPVSFGTSLAANIEITKPINDFLLQKEKERFYGIIIMEGKKLGYIELPICDGLVTAGVVKDVIAIQFAWSILSCFFEYSVYKNSSHPLYIKNEKATVEMIEAYHNKNGWLLFLQQIWNRSGWKQDQFYNSENNFQIKDAIINESSTTTIEVGSEFPGIITKKDLAEVVYTIGGTPVGKIYLPVKNGVVSSQQLRASININGSYELCVAAVREGILGKPLNEKTTLHQRLQETVEFKANQHSEKNVSISFWYDGVQKNLLLLTRRNGPVGMPASRRYQLPATTGTSIIRLAHSVKEPFMAEKQDEAFDYIFYVPDLLASSHFQTENSKTNHSDKALVNQFDRQHFETLFSKQPDPWKYTHPYEQTKYDYTLSLLPQKRFKTALEIACAEGHFTEQLAPLVDKLTAADISQVAIERTAERCSHFSHIDYLQLDVVKDPIQRQYDLIVCSEVLYFVGSIADLQKVAAKISTALLPDGYFITAHAHQIIDEPAKAGYDWGLPFGAKKISDVFSSQPDLQLVKEIRTPLYRVQAFQRKTKSLFRWLKNQKPEIIQIEQPTAVPQRVENTVRWHGGTPDKTSVKEKIVSEQLPILMYHRIAPEGSEKMLQFRVHPDAFEEQLRYLRDSNYYSVSWQEWINAMATRQTLRGKPIALTFDDGYFDFYEHAWPLLKKYNFTATVFLVANYIGGFNEWDVAYGDRVTLMNWVQIKQLQAEGVQFGAHTTTHPPLTGLSPADIVEEFANGRALLVEKLSNTVNTIAYPYGDVDGAVAHLAGGCGFQLGFTCKPYKANTKENPLLLPRIEITGSDKLQDFIMKLS